MGLVNAVELYDPDRLRNPVRQMAGRGSAEFESLYWEDALALLADKLAATPPDRIAFLGGNLSTHLDVVVRRFLEALGAPAPVGGVTQSVVAAAEGGPPAAAGANPPSAVGTLGLVGGEG